MVTKERVELVRRAYDLADLDKVHEEFVKWCINPPELEEVDMPNLGLIDIDERLRIHHERWHFTERLGTLQFNLPEQNLHIFPKYHM